MAIGVPIEALLGGPSLPLLLHQVAQVAEMEKVVELGSG